MLNIYIYLCVRHIYYFLYSYVCHGYLRTDSFSEPTGRFPPFRYWVGVAGAFVALYIWELNNPIIRGPPSKDKFGLESSGDLSAEQENEARLQLARRKKELEKEAVK